MNRIASWIVAAVTMFVFSPLVSQAQTTACELGKDLRAALGFGAQELAAMGVSGNTHTSIINAATTFCNDNRATIESLISTYVSARQAALGAYEAGDDPAATDAALQTAISDLESASGTVISTMRGYLSSEQQTAQGRLTTNRLLETSLALLDLTSEQRTTLKSAQKDRDAVLRHQKNRKNAALVASAQATFDSAVTSALDSTQRTQRSDYQNACRTNLDSARTTETNACN